MDTTQKEWRDAYMGSWCASPAIVDGHKVACSLQHGHEGDCVATSRDVALHRGGGLKACTRAGC